MPTIDIVSLHASHSAENHAIGFENELKENNTSFFYKKYRKKDSGSSVHLYYVIIWDVYEFTNLLLRMEEPI